MPLRRPGPGAAIAAPTTAGSELGHRELALAPGTDAGISLVGAF